MLPTIVSGAKCRCSFGSAEQTDFTVLPRGITQTGVPVATVDDFIFGVNFMDFKDCSSPNNPAVLLAGGPVKCTPIMLNRWQGSQIVNHMGAGLLNMSSVLLCQWNGAVTFLQPAQVGLNNL